MQVLNASRILIRALDLGSRGCQYSSIMHLEVHGRSLELNCYRASNDDGPFHMYFLFLGPEVLVSEFLLRSHMVSVSLAS